MCGPEDEVFEDLMLYDIDEDYTTEVEEEILYDEMMEGEDWDEI